MKKNQKDLLMYGAIAAGVYLIAKKKQGSVSGIGYTGYATVAKSMKHLSKAVNEIWNSGIGYTLSREDQIKIGEAKAMIFEVAEKYGYKIEEKGKVSKR
jgi:hypothetical protein